MAASNDHGEKRKKSVAKFLAEKEQSEKVNTLTQCFKNVAKKLKSDNRAKSADGAKRYVRIKSDNGWMLEEYNPGEKYCGYLPDKHLCNDEKCKCLNHYCGCPNCDMQPFISHTRRRFVSVRGTCLMQQRNTETRMRFWMKNG